LDSLCCLDWHLSINIKFIDFITMTMRQ
jgi:hypothetical protein